MLEYFQDKSPFIYNYFSNLLELVFQNKRYFPQSIIFEGNDVILQYMFSLELARLLNCKENRNNDCHCINCNWIRSFTHPAIINVSQLHFKPEGDESKTVISVKQAKEISTSLKLSSDYHRFYIFFSSKENNQNKYSEFANLQYNYNSKYTIEPLEYKTFHPTTLNTLLKSVEEPPKNTTFIFLTNSKENILPTIVSRSLVFKLNSNKKQTTNINYELFNKYFKLNIDNAFDVSLAFQNIIKDEQKNLVDILNEFIEFLKEVLLRNIDNQNLCIKINNDIKHILLAIKQAKSSMQDKIILDTLFLLIVRGY